MKTRLVVTALVLAGAVAAAAEADAQLFGSRTLGSSSVTRRAQTAGSNVGEVSGNERYIRGNRQENNFVGVDAQDARHFVGSQLTAPSSLGRTSTSPVTIEHAPDANRAASASGPQIRKGGMYGPRLAIGFQHPPLASEQVSTSRAVQVATLLAHHLESVFSKSNRAIEVSLEGGKATLTGEVSSERERTLAGLLALFEPGISKVDNELVVKSVSAPDTGPARQPPAARAPAAPQPRNDPAKPSRTP